jgi:hypothetical protein
MQFRIFAVVSTRQVSWALLALSVGIFRWRLAVVTAGWSCIPRPGLSLRGRSRRHARKARRGLMFRQTLAADAGMLFDFKEVRR